jgi:hypothetical protein
VSRDRSSFYSEAAVKATPQATQIADRWHLLRNLSEALIGALAPYHRLMTEAAQAVCGKPSPDAVEMPRATSRMNQRAAARQRSRERRKAVYETAMELVRCGLPQPEVARRLSIDCRIVDGSNQTAFQNRALVGEKALSIVIANTWTSGGSKDVIPLPDCGASYAIRASKGSPGPSATGC